MKVGKAFDYSIGSPLLPYTPTEPGSSRPVCPPPAQPDQWDGNLLEPPRGPQPHEAWDADTPKNHKNDIGQHGTTGWARRKRTTGTGVGSEFSGFWGVILVLHDAFTFFKTAPPPRAARILFKNTATSRFNCTKKQHSCQDRKCYRTGHTPLETGCTNALEEQQTLRTKCRRTSGNKALRPGIGPGFRNLPLANCVGQTLNTRKH